MSATFYARAGDATTSETSYNPSLCAKNKLNLLPEHVAEISTAFISQLSLSRLTSRDFRVLNAIFKQTIGYNKREDDMNPACLEMLTDIRGDHASASVRRLATLNIILTRKGSYGKWMSINFDFINWGEERSESTTNDPSCLLSDDYQTVSEEDLFEFKLHTLPESRKKEPVDEIIKEEQNTVQPQPDLPSETATVAVIKEEQNTVPPEPTLPSESATVAVIKGEQCSVLPQPDLPSKSAPSPVKHPPLSATQKPEVEAFKLNFPTAIPEKLHQPIIDHLGNLYFSKKTQPLLDYFAQCLNNGKVRSPIAYFLKLKDRWINGILELNQTPNQPQQQYFTEHDKTIQQQQIESRSAYQDAINNIQHIKNLMETIMEQTKTTFEEALKEINYTQLWKKAVERLEQTRKVYVRNG